MHGCDGLDCPAVFCWRWHADRRVLGAMAGDYVDDLAVP